ncbi:hypothetical protein [Paenibacillus amylolyticus]|uniref:hypothetical protein n=1 Tax=Paenibacillus amylolyticus TaxID=1451 RepID=UPI0015C2FB0A|nr:hypothetical protein [Paenibacillus amylolyticus]
MLTKRTLPNGAKHGDEGLTVNGQTTDCPELQLRTAAGWSFFCKNGGGRLQSTYH